MVKNPPANVGDEHSIPGSGRSPGGGSGNPLQNTCKENLMNIGALQAPVHGVPKSWTWLSNWSVPGKFSVGTGLVKGSENDLELETGVVTQHGEYTECYLAANF